MNTELPKAYDPSDVEENLYSQWLARKYFHAEVDFNRKKFSIVIPPPNVTGSLHIGHALNNTLQDVIVRKKRMEGFNAAWIPGTDHAGIATQNVVERELAREGLTRHQLAREKFIERVWQWKEEYGARIINQLKRLGASCDWDRERFTMDEGCSRAVRKAFVTLFNEGLIYRGNYIINWCPRCLTALSDIEVEHEEESGKLYYIRYPLEDGSGYITVATTRPETMLGDTAVAVNPADERYRHLIGKTAVLPLIGRKLKIIADEYVDMEFGTGALKVTPAHDPNDFELGRKHNLEFVNIFTDEAVVNENGGPYAGLSREEARERVVEDLKAQGLLEKVEDLDHAVGRCYRCNTTVEPYLSTQWFVRMKPLAEPAIQAVKDGRIKFFPEKYTSTYFQWLENIRDWCISRQIWWGHRIPVWYCDDCGEVAASETDLNRCPACGSENIRQDEDVLDTWFSSALWPFSTLGWPDSTPELNYFYPTDLLVTGYDIIFFWVARMIMMGLKLMGDVPFYHVHVHTLVRDEHGQKMSKSRGNVIDPLVMIDKYGADAVRFALAYLAAPGQNIYLSESSIEGARSFANKIWNASRFALMNIDDTMTGDIQDGGEESGLAERWILSRLDHAVEEVHRNLEVYDFAGAASAVYNFFWDDFCDVYVELSKIAFYNGGRNRQLTGDVIVHVLKRSLALLHPFMPFITEHIYRKLPGAEETLVLGPYPAAEGRRDMKAEEVMEEMLDCVRNVRALKADIAMPNLRDFRLTVRPDRFEEEFSQNSDYIAQLTGAAEVVVDRDAAKPEGSFTAVYSSGEAYVSGVKGIEHEQLKGRLKKRLAELEKEIAQADRKLSNEGFLKKAPEEVVSKVKEERETAHQRAVRLRELLKDLEQ